MSLKYSIGFGIITWLIVSWLNVIATMPDFKMFELWLYTALMIGVLGFGLAMISRPKTLFSGLLYGLVWIAIAMLMDVAMRTFLPLLDTGSLKLDASIFTYTVVWVEYELFYLGVVFGSLIASAKAPGWDKKPAKKSNKVEPPEEIGAGGPASPMR